MQVDSVQELEDRTLRFSGTMSEKEATIVVALGLNTLWANGLMHIVGDVDVGEDEDGPSEDETIN